MSSSSRRTSTFALGMMMVVSTLLVPLAGRAEAARKHKVAKAGEVHSSKGAAREERAVCQASVKKGRTRARTEHLVEAKDVLATCSRSVCSAAVRRACGKLASSVEADLPSVIPAVSHAPSSDVEVKLDGLTLTTKADGQAFAVNPGRHELTFATEGTVFATERVVIEKGQQNRRIAVDGPARSTATNVASTPAKTSARDHEDSIDKSAAASAEAARTVDEAAAGDEEAEEASPRRKAVRQHATAEAADASSTWPTYALGGIGVLGVGGFAALNWKGRQDNQTLLTSCAPNCKPSSVHHVRLMYLAADISLAVGFVALAAATYLYLRSPTEEVGSTASLTGIRRFDLRPMAGGTVATLSGSF